jgi:hypothetical protein
VVRAITGWAFNVWGLPKFGATITVVRTFNGWGYECLVIQIVGATNDWDNV